MFGRASQLLKKLPSSFLIDGPHKKTDALKGSHPLGDVEKEESVRPAVSCKIRRVSESGRRGLRGRLRPSDLRVAMSSLNWSKNALKVRKEGKEAKQAVCQCPLQPISYLEMYRLSSKC